MGWVDLASPQCESQLLEFKEHPKFVGIRHVTHDEPDDDFIVRPDVLRGLAVLQKHRRPVRSAVLCPASASCAAPGGDVPELPMVIDHLAKPEIKQQRTDNWLENFRQAARFPNMYCKLSGMVTEADWKKWQPSDLKPYVETAFEAFGAERCMFGSDWPVCELAGSYEQVYHALREVLGALSESEQSHIFGQTATRFYGLAP